MGTSATVHPIAFASCFTASSESAVRHRFAPYLAVVRIVFDDLQVDPAPPLLTLRFSYDQH